MRVQDPGVLPQDRGADAELFVEYPEAVENTGRIASLVNFSLKFRELSPAAVRLPAGFPSPMAYLGHLARRGERALAEEKSAPVRRRSTGSASKWSWGSSTTWDSPPTSSSSRTSSPGRGAGHPRGSRARFAAGSLVAFALGIVDVDPLVYDLIFERFLNPARISMPDIDVDVCQRRRGEVLQYIRERYGEKSVCQIITFKPLKAKGVVRDVARVLGFPYELGDRISKAIPNDPRSPSRRPRSLPELRAMEAADPQVAQILAYGSRLTDINRNYSVHAAGVVITPGETSDFVPWPRTPRGRGSSPSTPSSRWRSWASSRWTSWGWRR